ncbi:hypothetical protein PR202_ga15506 [Eleusine coracana subsp. coracana]|uniref:25S rRNA (uridine-N(3))-methyltransferase BMT5-like domain-containing protein n=1 Tax=Eleusine coracana subsp. coracana TaxID=191504 RepID=A0AAV5CK81_ELECO|nr:hypothetical protein PR202_ga15506 [Eleusine coracana subsp. coracana]
MEKARAGKDGVVKWLKHYSSEHSILIVGDGDFSFSLALATAFGSGANLVATSLGTYGFLGPESKVLVIKYALYNLRLSLSAHKELVRGFFRSASYLLQPQGEIHVTHKISHPYDSWYLEKLASESSLVLIKKVRFQKEDYPGYNQKRGSGAKCDQHFKLDPCCTFQVPKFKRRSCRKGLSGKRIDRIEER